MTGLYKSETEVLQVVTDFESCVVQPSSFNHHKHITVAMYYLSIGSQEETRVKIKRGLIKLLEHHGAPEEKVKSLYNETITLFWIRLLHHLMCTKVAGQSLFEQINWVLQHYGTMTPVFKHYSRDLVFSANAKADWVEPDLVAFPF